MQTIPPATVREVGMSSADTCRAIRNPLTPAGHPALVEFDRRCQMFHGAASPAGPAFGHESVRERMATRWDYDSVE